MRIGSRVLAFSFRSLRTRLLVAFLALGLTPLAVLGAIAYQRSHDALLAKSAEALQVHAASAIDKIDRNLFERYGDVQAFAFHPFAQGTPEQVTAAADFFMKTYGIYDLMVVADANGTVVAVNSIDWQGQPIESAKLVGRSVRGEPWFDRIAAGEIRAGQTFFEDVARDAWVAEVGGGADARALGFAAPIHDAEGRLVRVWSNRASWSRVVGQIAQELHEGIEASGVAAEVAVLSKTGLLLDAQRLADRVLALDLAESGSMAAAAAARGESGFVEEAAFDGGEPHGVGYARSKGALGFAGYGWSVLVSVRKADLIRDVVALRNAVLSIAGLAALAVAAIGLLLAASIARPLRDTAGVLERVAAGDLTPRVESRGRDEIGRMGSALDRALAAIREMIAEIRDATTALSGSAEELSATSRQMRGNAGDTQTRAQTASTTAGEASRSVQTVASGAEEMAACIAEIAKSASEAARVASDGATAAQGANARVSKLDAAGQEISEVSDAIKSIADQTNQLATSATTQAVEAEKASKGFAVVAYEVKDLAKQTAESTHRIGPRIHAIQRDSRSAIESVAAVGETLARLEDLAAGIQAALGAQLSASGDASDTAAQGRSLREAARHAGEASAAVRDALATVRKIDGEVHQLDRSSTEVDQVIRAINTIARQTNLLALNASIEAQRAGDAARGFGGVAQEVRTLAAQTTDATGRIRVRIDGIQTEARATVSAMGALGERVDRISQISATIASAVEEQSATASEITRNVTDAAQGIGEIATNVAGVAQAADGTATGASEVLAAASELARLAGQLNTSIERFQI